ncbi:MAG: Coenzyme F420 hydrogenase/dehydrogenase, beta subunit C-terminal domain [Sneathiella sp.]
MFNKKINSIDDVVQYQLCTGCGACAFVEPLRFEMDDDLDIGRRPFLKEDAVAESGKALTACPGANLTHEFDRNSKELIPELIDGWGPANNVWEGYSAIPAIRHGGSSGGAATALSVFAIEKKGFAGVLHTNANKNIPYLNETVFSRTRDDLQSTTGSRYAPASPCDGLGKIMQENGPSVFIGKPCDVAAVHKARIQNPELNEKVGLTIAFFCAGTPSTQGTLDLLKEMGIEDPTKVKSLRYRGNGWPGRWTAVYHDADDTEKMASLTYAESWGFLQKYRQWRCYICPDHTGEFADIAVGDPWYREVEPDESGKSLIVARTESGRKFVLEAEKAGYIKLEKNEASLLPKSQPNILVSRGNVWPRIIILRLLGAAIPTYTGFVFLRFWLKKLNWTEKRQSILGTIIRVFRKNLRHRIKIMRQTQTKIYRDR